MVPPHQGEGSGPPPNPKKKRPKNNPFKENSAGKNYLLQDKYGIVITTDPPSNNYKVNITMDTPGTCVIKFLIENTGTSAVHFLLYKPVQRHGSGYVTLSDQKQVTEANPLCIYPGHQYEVQPSYNPKEPGKFTTTMSFKFRQDEGKQKIFYIWRDTVVEVRTALHKELGPEAPYRPFKVPSRPKYKPPVEEGVRPNSSQSPLGLEVKLKGYPCRHDRRYLARCLAEDSASPPEADAQKVERLKDNLKPTSNMKRYAERFHDLLHLEEIQMEVDIRKYDLKDQTMTQDDTRNKHLLKLKVPGLLESRPSVLYGDVVLVNISGENKKYSGYVHKVERDTVMLGFSERLWRKFISNMKFDVEFVASRLLLRLQHRAVDLARKHQLRPLLFPTAAAVGNVALPELRMYNRQLEQNPEQCAAVRHIVAGSSKPAPYLIFGPPGTGKTITLVEAIKQVCRQDSSAHILACAPTNCACDVLCERLIEAGRSIFRMYAISRSKITVPSKLLKYSNWDEEQQKFVYPAKEELMEYKIMVTTLFTAGRMVTGGIPEGHFTHVFVDEAGQAPEPECLVAVAGLLNPQNGQLVLAGDPMQLGPIIHSPLAKQYGLGLSLLERLMNSNDLYRKVEGSDRRDQRYITKLLQNYRSHQSILHVPNEEFYDGELQACADRMKREVYCNWKALPQKNFPVIFHGVEGNEERECSSPSFFNVYEIEVLLNYLTQLFEAQGKQGIPKLSAKDVGIITPYRKQVEKVRKALSKKLPARVNHSDIKVGCVEEFQGEERRITLVSTVRSSEEHFSFGFLSNEKRFNVAVTRAMSLLIVVGNHLLLSKIPVWKKFIDFCGENNSCVGFDPEDLENNESMSESMSMTTEEDADAAWKNEE